MKFLYSIFILSVFPFFANAQCPVIEGAMINACATPPSTSEGINEFVLFTTTAPAIAQSYLLGYSPTNPPSSVPFSANILTGANARTKNGTGTITSTNGCTINAVTSPLTNIPTGSQVIMIPSNFDADYDVTAICSSGTLYVIYVDITAFPSSSWQSNGTFANSPTAPRYLQITNGANTCASGIRTFDNSWAANTDGNSVWWNATGTPTYQNNGCTTVTPPVIPPTITPGATGGVCEGILTDTLSFTTTGNPDQYSIDWNAAANAAGFTDVTGVALPSSSPLSFAIPPGVTAGVYTGSITSINSLTGDISVPKTFSVTVNAPPVITLQPVDTTQYYCQNSPVTPIIITALPGSGSITNYQWYLVVGANSAALPGATSFTFTPSSAGLGTLRFFCIVTNSNGCRTRTDTSGAFIISANVAKPIATATVQPTCIVPTGTIVVTSPVGVNIRYSDGGPFQLSGTFTGLAPGTYNITAKNSVSGCTSAITPVTIDPVPAIPATPTASVTVQPTCVVNTGTIEVNSPLGANFEYSDGGPYQAGTTFSGLINGTVYNITARDIITGCVSNAFPVTVNTIPGAPPVPTATVTVQPSCTISTGTVAVTAPSGINYFYSIGGPYQANGIFTGLTAGTTYSVTARDTSTGCISAPLSITVDPIPATPAAPIVTSPVFYCQNEIVTIPLTATGSNLLWYSAATGGTGSATAPTPSTNIPVSTIYYVSQAVNGCESPRAAITVTIRTSPSTPVISTPTITYCQNKTAATLTAAGTNLLWYTAGSGGTGSAIAPLPSTAGVGSTLFFVSQTVNGCESGRSFITVNVNATPAAPTVTSPADYCENAVAVQLSATGTGLLWYNAATGGTGSSTAPTPNTSPAATTTYYVSQTSNGCESPRAAITVTVNATPPAPVVTSPVIYCQNVTATALSASGTNLLWYTAATGGLGNAAAPTPFTGAGSNTNYYVSQTVNGCESARGIITVTVNAAPAAPVVIRPVVYCANEIAVPLTAAGSNLLWYQVANAPAGSGSATAPTPATSSAGTILYFVSETVNGCESGKSFIDVVINPTPAAPAVTSLVVYCQNATAPALTATGTGLLWYGAATGGTGNATAPTPATNAAGSSFYYVSQTTNGCESSRSMIEVKVNALPAAPTVTPAITYCQKITATVLSATGSGLLWYTQATGGTSTGTAPTPSTLNAGNTIYYVSQTVNGCEGPRASTTITVNPAPLAPVVNTPIFYCLNTTAQQLTATGTNLLWYGTATGGTGNTTAPTPLTTTAGNTFYYVSQTNSFSCESPRVAITVAVSTVTTPVTGFRYSPDTVCKNSSVTPGPVFDINFKSGGIFSSTTGISVNAANGNINLAASNPGTYLITYNYTANGCILGGTSNASITINPTVSSNTIFSYTSPICKNDVNPSPAFAPGFTTGGQFNSSTGLSLNVSTGLINLAASNPGIYQVTYSLPKLGCRLATSNFSFVSINANTIPVTDFKYNPRAVCPGDADPVLVLAQNFNGGGLFAATPAGLAIDEVSGDIDMNNSLPGGYIVTYSRPKLGCRLAGSSNDTFVIRSPLPAKINFSYAGPVCKNDSIILPVTDSGFSLGGRFTSAAGLAINPNSGLVNIRQSTPGIYQITYGLPATVCSQADTSTASLEIFSQPAAPAISNEPVCSGGIVVLKATGSGIIRWYSDAAGTILVNTGDSFITTINASSRRFYLTSSAGSCTSALTVADAVISPIPPKPNLGGDSSICKGDVHVLSPGAYSSYTWQDGSKQPTFTVTAGGNYTVTVTNSAGCKNAGTVNITVLDNCDDIQFPTAFSPNGDGLNEKFGAYGNLFIVKNYTLTIFNRYGEMVFQTDNPYRKWDGTYRGKMYGNTNFVWVATYTYKDKTAKTQKGNVMVVR